MGNHLHDALLRRRGDDDRCFIATPEGRRITFGEWRRLSGRIANALVEMGVRPGDRVALQAEKSPEALAVFYGAVRAGAVFLPLNPAYTPAEMAHFLDDAAPRLLICDPGGAAALAPLADKVGAALLTLDGEGDGSFAECVAASADDFDNVARGPEELAALLYTSGTTGRAKGAMLSHGNLLSNTEALADLWRFTAQDILLHALPIYHTHGLFVATNLALITGAGMIFFRRFDSEALIANMDRATVLMGAPTFYTRLLDAAGLTAEATAGMRLFISGSAPLLAETHRRFQARTGHAILERYGMTETGMNASNPCMGARRAGSVGPALPGVALRIADPESGAALPRGEIGMVEVRGPNVCGGYWRQPEKTAAEFRADGYFITGDLGLLDADGYLTIVGRGRDLVISGGLNVYPKEVEACIDALPGVLESAVIGLPHPDLGEAVTAIVVGEAGHKLTERDVTGGLHDRLAGFKRPKRAILVEALPRNAMGKVQKNLLREAHADLYAAPPPDTAPDTTPDTPPTGESAA